jgi:uncharacterized phage-like protein YoqJ
MEWGDSMTVTFCGHRDIVCSDKLTRQLRFVLYDLISEGADTFLLGGYGTFDSIAAMAVRGLKSTYPNLRSTLVLAYLDRDYNAELYDDTIYPPLEGVSLRYAISQRNRWMVDASDVVVSYVAHSYGGAATTLRYAEQKHKRIIWLVE